MKLKNLQARSVFFLCLLPLTTFVLVAHHLYHHGISYPVLALTVFYYYATGMSITGGYHRLFAHRTYQAPALVRWLYSFFGAAAFQDSVITWCTDHRYHHNYTDTDKDPYNAQRGFWFSHMGWMLSKLTPVEPRKGELMTKDLRKDPILMWQHKHYVPYALFSGFAIPALIGWSFGEAYSAFLFAGLFRTVMVHQYTFLINSAAHKWGSQTYGTKYSAKDSSLLSFFTYGEGYHNFHHHFQNDYRNGVRWYDFDPTKWLIRSLKGVGLAHSLKKIPDHEILLARVKEQKRLLDTQQIMTPLRDQIESIQEKLSQAAERWKKVQADYNQLAQELRDKKDHRLKALRIELQTARREIRLSYRHWQKVVNLALELSQSQPQLMS